jgi:uncharacterized delta-60 repeat protein
MITGLTAAAPPDANFTGTPIIGTAPLTVSFTDQSTGSPTGWAWYFGDETYTEPWTQVNVSAGWSAREGHSSVVMPDGSIVVMGGNPWKNDTWRSTDNGATWTLMNGSGGWSAREEHSSVVMPDGSIVLMGGNTGSSLTNDVWRSTDNGATWTQMTASAGWGRRSGHSSVVMPDGSIVLMGGGTVSASVSNDVWRSTDNGATWTQMTASAGWTAREGHKSVAMPDGSIVLMGGNDNSGINKNDTWRSTDNGATWTQMTTSAGWSGRNGHTSVTMPDGSIVLMGGSANEGFKNDVWRSMDYGATWIQVNGGTVWVARAYHSCVGMPDGSIVLMGGDVTGFANDYKNDVWRFMPAGSSAQNPLHTYTTPGNYQVTLQAYNASSYDSTRKAGYITVNAPPPAPVANFTGTPTFGRPPLTVSFTDLSSNYPTGWAWFFGDESYTGSWTQVNASPGWSNRYYHSSVVMPDGSIVLMGGNMNNDVWRSTDNGTTWVQVTGNAGWSALEGQSCVVMPDGSIVLMGGSRNDVWRSNDYGATWILVSAGFPNLMAHSSVVMPDGSIIVMGTFVGLTTLYESEVWKSTDYGATWTLVTDNPGWSDRQHHSSVVTPDGSIILIGGGFFNNDVWKSSDNGTTWARQTSDAEWPARCMHTSVAMPDGSIVLMGGRNNGIDMNDVWRSTNNGTNWIRLPDGGWLPREAHSSVVLPDGSIVLMGGWGYPTLYNDVWRFMPAGSSAQNPVHTYTTPGNYTVSLQAYNAGGYNTTRKAGYITVNFNEGSDSDYPTPLPTSTTIPTGTNITETVNVGGGSAVTRAEMTGTDLGKNLVISAFPKKSLPLGMVTPNTTVYQYLSIVSSAVPGVVNKTAFDFSVPQSWLTEHGFTAGDIVMMHYENEEWQTLDTWVVAENGGNVFYRAITPGFSYFAIAYLKDGTNMGTGTPLPTTLVPVETPVSEAPSPVTITTEKTQIVPQAPVTDPVNGTPLTTIIVGFIGASAIIAGAFLVRRWWIRKQNPALFRKYD